MRASYTVIMNRSDFMVIKDNCLQNNTMSVTNDAENVVAHVHAHTNLYKGKILYYVDTDNRVDSLGHDGLGNFTTFIPGFNNLSELKQFYGIIYG